MTDPPPPDVSERKGDPGPAYWLTAAAVALTLTAAAPFFWVPPLWTIYLMSRPPGDRDRQPATASEPDPVPQPPGGVSRRQQGRDRVRTDRR